MKEMINIGMPSDDDLHTSYLAQYERVAFTFIDQWPAELRALSFPTKLVWINPDKLNAAFWEQSFDPKAANELATIVDAEMGWDNWFIRLNSRSPKDAMPTDAPWTCSGKQAISWIGASERCLDDAQMFKHARKPMFVCLRKAQYMHPDLEFRCFAKGGQVIGVSRYFYNRKAEHRAKAKLVWKAATEFYRHHLAGYPDIVFDLYAPGRPNELLIEINPYGLSDPCLFGDYATLEAKGGVRLTPTKETDHGG